MEISENEIKCGCRDGWKFFQIKKGEYRLCIVTQDGICFRHPPSGHTQKAIMVKLTWDQLTDPNFKRNSCKNCGKLFFELKEMRLPHMER